MLKVDPFVNVKSWALPLAFVTRSLDGERVKGSVSAIQFLCVGLQFLHVVDVPEEIDEKEIERRLKWAVKADRRMTKKYFDGRQKTPRNRKRKPSKAMRNLYQLG